MQRPRSLFLSLLLLLLLLRESARAWFVGVEASRKTHAAAATRSHTQSREEPATQHNSTAFPFFTHLCLPPHYAHKHTHTHTKKRIRMHKTHGNMSPRARLRNGGTHTHTCHTHRHAHAPGSPCVCCVQTCTPPSLLCGGAPPFFSTRASHTHTRVALVEKTKGADRRLPRSI